MAPLSAAAAAAAAAATQVHGCAPAERHGGPPVADRKKKVRAACAAGLWLEHTVGIFDTGLGFADGDRERCYRDGQAGCHNGGRSRDPIKSSVSVSFAVSWRPVSTLLVSWGCFDCRTSQATRGMFPWDIRHATKLWVKTKNG